MVDIMNQIWPPSAITFQLHISGNHKVLKAGLTLSCIAILTQSREITVKEETVPKGITAPQIVVQLPI